MAKPEVLIFENTQLLVEAFTQHFIKLIMEKPRDFSVALSGGSTPKVWFEHLAKNHQDDIPWNKVHFYWGDERCVPPEDDESNYGMTKKYLLDRIDIPKENIHRVQGELAPKEASDVYAKDICKNLRVDKVPVFDLVILGMGDDGHTASIFPHQIDLWNSKDFCVVATHPVSGQQRVSLSGKVINAARSIAFLVTGANKAEKVREILSNEKVAATYPASLVDPDKLTWFLDGSAASEINQNA